MKILTYILLFTTVFMLPFDATCQKRKKKTVRPYYAPVLRDTTQQTNTKPSVRNYYSDAESYYNKGSYDNATKLFKVAQVLQKIDATNYLEKCNRCSNLLNRANEADKSNDVETAKAIFNELLRVNPTDNAALAYIERQNIPEWQKQCEIISLGNNEYLAVQNYEFDACPYKDAIANANSSRLGEFNDWRIPDENEMRTIAHLNKYMGNYWILENYTEAVLNITVSNGYRRTAAGGKSAIHHTISIADGVSKQEYIDKYDNNYGSNKFHKFKYLVVRKFKKENSANIKDKDSQDNTNTTTRTVTGHSSSSIVVKTVVQ